MYVCVCSTDPPNFHALRNCYSCTQYVPTSSDTYFRTSNPCVTYIGHEYKYYHESTLWMIIRSLRRFAREIRHWCPTVNCVLKHSNCTHVWNWSHALFVTAVALWKAIRSVSHTNGKWTECINLHAIERGSVAGHLCDGLELGQRKIKPYPQAMHGCSYFVVLHPVSCFVNI